MSSDSSSIYEATYSEDERYEQYIKEKKLKEEEEAREHELERAEYFVNYYNANISKKKSIFYLKGIDFLKFTHKKIKFSFRPCRVARLVSPRVIFYISLRYGRNNWLLKRDSIPANFKLQIYSLFYTNGSFSLTDDNFDIGIIEIWKILRKWAQKEHLFRQAKHEKYRKGEEVYLDKDDEDLFLSDSEIEELHRKRKAIWERMLPPPPSKMFTEGPRTRRKRILSPSPSTSIESSL